jgi:hypothetical protein
MGKETPEEVQKKIDSAFKDEPTPVETPATPPKETTPAVEPLKPETSTETPVQTTETPKQTTETASTETTPPETPKTYVGDKYTNEFDLMDGVLEEVKALKLDKKEVIDLFREAQKSGDYSKVESKYKELQTQVQAKVKEEKTTKTETPPEETLSDEDSTGTGLSDKEFNDILLKTTHERLQGSNLAEKFKRWQVEFPKTDQELDELEIKYPTLYTQYVDTFQHLYDQAKSQAEAFRKADKEAPAHNEKLKNEAKQQIGEFISEWKVDLKPEEVDKIVTDALKSKQNYEKKEGVDFLRDGAIYEWFMAKKAPTILKEIRVKTLNEGRMQGAQDVAKAKTQTPKTISTTATPASATKTKEVDLTDHRQVKAAGEDFVHKKLKEIFASDVT